MSKHTEDGGYAFPMPPGLEPRVDQVTHYNEGMTLRDYFAAQAMQAYFGYIATTQAGIVSKHYLEVATEAYNVADAMISARAKEGQ